MNDSTLKSGNLLKSGEYRIERTLGQGGFGITYEAEQTSLGRKVAVKEFFMKEYCERDGGTSHVTMGTSGSRELVSKFKDKFIREARMIAALDHEHIVKIIDVFEENGTAYYVMEYLGGGSLDRKIKDKGAMPESVALDFIRQIASALDYLHSQNILHFDIKPANVLLGKNGSAKLIDFGISKHYDEAGHQTSSTPVGISKGYAPLEQYQQGSDIKSFTPATDIYSLGATLYALLSGSNPPEASVVNEDGVPAIEGISHVVMHTIEKAMEPRRKYRPQSVQEFLGLLNGTAKEDDSEETIVSVADAKSKGAKSDKEKNLTESEKPGKPQKLKVSKESDKKSFPKWTYGLFAGVAVAVLAAVLLNRPDKVSAPDNVQTDSTVVIAEAIPEKPVTSKLSISASKPETLAKPEAPAVIELNSITLSKTALELEEGSSATLTVKYSPSNATDKTTTWKSTDASIVKVSSSGKVTAVKAGSAAIVATCQDKDAFCNVNVIAKELQPSKPESVMQEASKPEQSASPTIAVPASIISPTSVSVSISGTHNGHEYVDLGLSVKWSTCNVGAASPEQSGDKFAWGETSTKKEYEFDNYKYSSGFQKYTKYNTQAKYGYRLFVDGKTTLDLTDDAASTNWGANWRTPTWDEFRELLDLCSWKLTSVNSEKGYMVTSSKNGNSVFFPISGLYMINHINKRSPHNLTVLSLSVDYYGIGTATREGGSYVRPVCP